MTTGVRVGAKNSVGSLGSLRSLGDASEAGNGRSLGAGDAIDGAFHRSTSIPPSTMEMNELPPPMPPPTRSSTSFMPPPQSFSSTASHLSQGLDDIDDLISTTFDLNTFDFDEPEGMERLFQ